MKRTQLFLSLSTVLLFILFSIPICAAGNSEDTEETVLNVYCYDSFSSEWGAGPEIAESFFQATGIRVRFNAPGDGVSVLNQLILEKENPRADVVIGLDSILLNRVLDAGILEVYDSPALSTVPSELVFDQSFHLLPFDYGHFAICYDSELIPHPPVSLEDLCDEVYTDSLVLMDPRTSTPGLGFLLWTVAVYGDEWPDYWQRLRPSILTITQGWSQGYTLFTAGEAPLVLSYGTSPVYHSEYEGSRRFRAAEFSDGHVTQVEGMGIVSGTQKRSEAELFMDYMLSEESQIVLAMSNIMFPSNKNIKLPESFDMALYPERTISISGISNNAAETEKLIKRWTEVFSR